MKTDIPVPCILHEGVYQRCLTPKDAAFVFITETFPLETIAWFMAQTFFDTHHVVPVNLEASIIRRMQELRRAPLAPAEADEKLIAHLVYGIVERSWERLHVSQFFLTALKKQGDALLKLVKKPQRLFDNQNNTLIKNTYSTVSKDVSPFFKEFNTLESTQQHHLLTECWNVMNDTWKAFAHDTFLDYHQHFINPKSVRHYLENR